MQKGLTWILSEVSNKFLKIEGKNNVQKINTILYIFWLEVYQNLSGFPNIFPGK